MKILVSHPYQQLVQCLYFFMTMSKKCKKANWLCEEALQIAEKRRQAKGKGEK